MLTCAWVEASRRLTSGCTVCCPPGFPLMFSRKLHVQDKLHLRSLAWLRARIALDWKGLTFVEITRVSNSLTFAFSIDRSVTLIYIVLVLTFWIFWWQKRYVYFMPVLAIEKCQISGLLITVINWCNYSKDAVKFLIYFYAKQFHQPPKSVIAFSYLSCLTGGHDLA